MKASSRIFESLREAGSGQGACLRRAAAIAVLLWGVAPLASAQIPYEMAYSGRLTDGSGAALSGPVNVQLRIFDQLEDGGVLYIEDHAAVELDENGFFQVPLGGGVGVLGIFEATLFTGMDRYLEVAVDGATLSPRQKMGSVPYAMQAEIAEQSSQADAANNAARLEGSTLSEILAMVPSDTEWTSEPGQVTTTNQVVIGAAASPAAETSLHVQGDTVVQGRLIAGSSGLDVASEITNLQERVAALGSPAPTRFDACSDGLTVADHQTGLLWERKTGTYESGSQASRIFCGPTGCPNPHDVNNIYSFSEVYSNFLNRLNGTMDPAGEPGCFARRCDWELPEISELQTLMIGPHSAPGQHEECTYPGPCIDPEFAAIAGPTFTSAYWSETQSPTAGEIYYGGFDAGLVLDTPTSDINWVRAVREGGCIPAAEYDGASSPSAGSTYLSLDGVAGRACRSDLPSELLGGAAKFAGAWVRPQPSSAWQVAFSMGWDTSGGAAPGGQTFELGVSESGAVALGVAQWGYESPHVVPFGEWSYVFMTWDSARDEYAVGFVDEGTVSKTYVAPENSASQKLSAGPICLGAYANKYGTYDKFFNGNLSKVSLLDHVPTDSEILELAAGPSNPSSFPGLLAYWALDQYSGTTAMDDTGNGWDLSLESGAIWSAVAQSTTCADGECLGVFGAATWDEADAFCQAWGGGLAMIRSESKNEAVRAVVGTGEAYIGLHEGGGPCNGHFCWVDDLYASPSLPYTAWAPGEPAVGKCGYIDGADGLWRIDGTGTNGTACGDQNERRFVCEQPE